MLAKHIHCNQSLQSSDHGRHIGNQEHPICCTKEIVIESSSVQRCDDILIGDRRVNIQSKQGCHKPALIPSFACRPLITILSSFLTLHFEVGA